MPPYNIMSTAAPRGEQEERSFTLQAAATWREKCNCKFFTQVAELVASTPLQSPAGWYLSVQGGVGQKWWIGPVELRLQIMRWTISCKGRRSSDTALQMVTLDCVIFLQHLFPIESTTKPGTMAIKPSLANALKLEGEDLVICESPVSKVHISSI